MILDGLWGDILDEVAPLLQRYRRDLARLEVREKGDRTLLTDADTAAEQLIVDKIREFDPNAVIVAEEDDKTAPRTGVLASPEWIWVVDPIDGTAEFVRPDRVEFCSVVCLLRHREPVAALVLAPELGRDRTPLTVTVDRRLSTIMVDGVVVDAGQPAAWPRLASMTRSANTPPHPFEAALLRAGYTVKTRTTSQTLDMVRTVVDLRPFVGTDLPPFRLFRRDRQKVWDGVAGLCLGETVGLRVVDGTGGSRLPVGVEILSQPEPTFDMTVMGPSEEVEWFLRTAQEADM